MKYVLILTLAAIGCTDAAFGKFTAIGDSATVECFSGGKLIGKWQSSGKVANSQQSDGYFFKDKNTGQFVEVSGNCILRYK